MKVRAFNYLIVVPFVLQLLLLLSLRFTLWPEVFSYPYLINNGFLIYKDFIYPYPPLLSLIFAGLFNLFGYEIGVVRAFAIVVSLLSNFFVLLVVKKISKSFILGLTASFVYSLLMPVLDGNMVWYDTALVLPVCASFYFLLNFLESSKRTDLFFSILLVTISFFVKQTTFIFGLAMFFVLFKKKKYKETFYIALFWIFICALFIFILLQKNIFFDFMNWNFFYPATFWTKFPGYVQMEPSRRELLIIGLMLGPILMVLFNFLAKIKNIFLTPFVLFTFGSFLSVYPRFSFFHFQLAFAFLVISIAFLRKKSFIFISIGGFLLAFILSLRGVSFQGEVRFFETQDYAISQRISEEVSYQKVYLLGLPSHYYVLGRIFPPKPWIDNFGWYMEKENVVEEMLALWSSDYPERIIRRIPSGGNWWELGTYESGILIDWISENYELKDKINDNLEVWTRRN